jgi:hypothetical protein
MQAERNKRMELMQRKLTGNAMEYTFEEAWVDLIDYFYAGTLEAGVQALTIETGKSAADAKRANAQAVSNRVATFTALKKSRVEINKREALTDKVKALKEQGKKEDAARILNGLGVSPRTGADVFDQLQDAVRDADDQGEEAIDKLLGPFGIKTQTPTP